MMTNSIEALTVTKQLIDTSKKDGRVVLMMPPTIQLAGFLILTFGSASLFAQETVVPNDPYFQDENSFYHRGGRIAVDTRSYEPSKEEAIVVRTSRSTSPVRAITTRSRSVVVASLEGSYLKSPLRLVAETSSGRDYKKRVYISYTWLIKNVGVSNVWLPLPRDRSQSKSMPIESFLHRVKVSEGWSSRPLGDHAINYEANWVILPPGETYELFTTTFFEEDERFKEVEVSLSYKDAAGDIHNERLSWSAVQHA